MADKLPVIPDGFSTSPEHWYGRWLLARDELDEEAAQRLSLHARIAELEAALSEAVATYTGGSYYTQGRWWVQGDRVPVAQLEAWRTVLRGDR